MKRIIYLFIPLLLTFSCEDLVDGINENPNKVPAADINPVLFLTGAQLANVSGQVGHIQRIASSWSGQLVGYQNLYVNLYRYSINSAETNSMWANLYQGVVVQANSIEEQSQDDPLLLGIAEVMEAHAIGTLAATFGDVPFAEAGNPEIDDPAFENQKAVFASLQTLLDKAIADLTAGRTRPLPQDIYYGGNRDKWVEAAWTLKARYYTLTKEYAQAFTAAQKGISKGDNSMLFKPLDSPNRDDKNIFNTLLSGSRTGDIGNKGSFLLDLLDAGGNADRNNAKTDEASRRAYLVIEEGSAAANKGVAGPLEPMPLVTYAENLLTLAEMAARTQGFDAGLQYLNQWRAYLNSGKAFKVVDAAAGLKYEPYEAADFQAGGIENADNIEPTRALLREIIEERYVSFFGQFLVFNDARRLRRDDKDIDVEFPFNTETATRHPERFNYPQDELNANPNAQEPAEGIYFVLEVNR